MNVLVIGSGGREYAMVKALTKSPSVTKVSAIPGSSAISEMAYVPSSVELSSHSAVLSFCKDEEINLVCFGPEAPLVDGLSDFLRENDINVFGPSQVGSLLEGDKLFAKIFLKEFDIPTGDYIEVSDIASLKKALDETSWQTYVFKYKDLAGGKGVLVSKSKDEVMSFAKKFGVTKNQKEVVGYLEEPLYGWELSYICLVNETGYAVCPILQDHKRLKEEDEGPNTGGMGVVGPLKIEGSLEEQIKETIVKPTLEGFKKRDMLYRGVVYFGVMVTEKGPKVLEYNVRYGDPEAQLIFPLVDTDWFEVMNKVAKGEDFKLPEAKTYGACIVLAADGYPEKPKKGAVISGAKSESIYHAGTRKDRDRNWIVNGGRVLNVLGFSNDLESAISKAYENVSKVEFKGMQYRKDIGAKIIDKSFS